ncbi:MAG TPA: 50S ribosomal protein L17 [Rhabdochlamydiaceae bacterium]|nr:50S ribosomal protein L17 [Rhabdochlamydiaceae bacterium]
MRHGKHTFKIGRTSSHRRCLIANMLKALIEHERIETTVTKAKELRRHADRMITLAKKNTLASRRQAIAQLMITFNHLTSKEAKKVKSGNKEYLNSDRQIISKLFGDLSLRFAARNGGYTRIIKKNERIGDNAPACFIEYVS